MIKSDLSIRLMQRAVPAYTFAELCLFLSFLGLSLSSCVDAPPYYYAEKITGNTFIPHHQSVGVYPNQSILNDPRNPFKKSGVSADATWEIEAAGDPVAGFYAWATRLSTIPTGENQFYAALNMKAIYERSLADSNDLEDVKAIAIAGFQAILDYFPESVTYDITGKIPYGLATLAYLQLIELDERPSGGWSLVSQEGGGVIAIKTLDVPIAEEE